MNTCDTCKHWWEKRTCFGLVPVQEDGGYRLRKREPHEPIGPATYPSMLLHTAPNYGCVHHDPK